MPFGGSLGWTEIVLVLIVALVIFGPGKLPEVGKAMGKTIREFKLAVNKIDADIKKEVDDIKDTVGVDDLKDLKASVDPTTLVKNAVNASSDKITVVQTVNNAAEAVHVERAADDPATEPSA